MALYMISDIAKSLTMKADEAITAGMLVKTTSSEIDTLTDSLDDHLTCALCDGEGDDTLCIGIALTDIASGSYGAVAMQGVFRLIASGAISAGKHVKAAPEGTYVTKVITLSAGDMEHKHIGRAVTAASADSNEIVIVLNTA